MARTKIHLQLPDARTLCGTFPWKGRVTEQVFNTTCERCLRSIVKRIPEAQAQIDWLRSQRQED